MTDVPVTQRDRELFKALFGFDGPTSSRYADDGQYDDDYRMQQIAKARIEAENRKVEEAAELCITLGYWSPEINALHKAILALKTGDV